MRKVSAVTDGEGHWYIIPSELLDKFHQLLNKGYEGDDYEEFSAVFDEYRTGGDLNLIQLYAEI